MTFEELESLVTDLKKRVDDIKDIDFKNISDFEQLNALDFDDILIAVTPTDYTGKVTLEQLMEYLNKNLKNFICWKPYVEDDTLKWERSSSDETPGEIKFADIIYPMASETANGMLSSDDYIKLASIRENEIVYNSALIEELQKYALKIHEHAQYQLKSEMPTLVSTFENDVGYITTDDIPKNVSAFTNDSKYITLDEIPTVSTDQSGLMTPAILNILSDIVDTYVSNDALTDILNESIPKVVSALENDVDYMPRSQIYTTFGKLGAVNIIRNGEFIFDEWDTESQSFVIAGWRVENGTIERVEDDPDFGIIGKATFTDNTILKALLTSSASTINTISFIAKAETSTKIKVDIGDGSDTVDIGTTWKLCTLTIRDNGSNPSMYVNFTLDDENTLSNILYITRVKFEYGSLSSEYYPSYTDLKDLIKVPASLTDYGAVIPDGNTIGINSEGKLYIIKGSENVQIDDDTASLVTVYSSSKTESRLATKAPIVDGKIPSEYLPSYVDDTIEGTMEIDADGNYIFTADEGQYGPSEPSKGIIYVDTKTNLLYRWSGSTYICIGGRDSDITFVNKIHRKDITVSEATDTIEIPSDMTSVNALAVYYNGLLMTKDVNYTISNSSIVAVDFEFAKDSTVTFLANAIETNVNASDISINNSDALFGGNSDVQSGMEYLSNAIQTLQANKVFCTTVSLLHDSWSEKSQTIKISKVTSDNTVVICPTSQSTYNKYDITCTSQGDQSLTFTCGSLPDVDLDVNLIIIN